MTHPRKPGAREPMVMAERARDRAPGTARVSVELDLTVRPRRRRPRRSRRAMTRRAPSTVAIPRPPAVRRLWPAILLSTAAAGGARRSSAPARPPGLYAGVPPVDLRHRPAWMRRARPCSPSAASTATLWPRWRRWSRPTSTGSRRPSRATETWCNQRASSRATWTRGAWSASSEGRGPGSATLRARAHERRVPGQLPPGRSIGPVPVHRMTHPTDSRRPRAWLGIETDFLSGR